MTRALNVRPPAELDILDAYDWYERTHRGLGETFVGEIDIALERICAHPFVFREVETSIRRAVLHTFPYLIFYTVDEFSIEVLGVLHAAQDPEYIRQRTRA